MKRMIIFSAIDGTLITREYQLSPLPRAVSCQITSQTDQEMVLSGYHHQQSFTMDCPYFTSLA
ncbi:hypothetical protein [Streptococcus halichoeri]|uniref:hypothetical protein n=1 Tax=Streptococcus halichoeri TaxID=254785 RepID=UPI00135CD889|nr:hypothetical protein [Streptococcus halichoeri]